MPTHAIVSPDKPPTVAVYQTESFTLTNDQVKALPSTPIEIMPAPGAGKMINVISTFLQWTIVGAYTNITIDSVYYISYDNDFTDNCVFGRVPSGGASEIHIMPPAVYPILSGNWQEKMLGQILPQALTANKPLYLISLNGEDGDYTGGNAGNSLKITLVYSIVDLT